MERKIIIPAGGKAVRFQGVLKELITVENSEISLLRTIRLAIEKLYATDIVIITNEDKRDAHVEFLQTVVPDSYKSAAKIHIIVQRDYSSDLWSALSLGLSQTVWDCEGGILLPDTVLDLPEQKVIKPGITFGTFQTTEPERFSIITDTTIVTKPQNFESGIYTAWGVVLWDRRVARDLTGNAEIYNHYDSAFRSMMDVHGFNVFPLYYYYDLGNIAAYIDYMADIQ